METIDDRSFKEKVEAGWFKVKQKAKAGLDWCVVNKELVVVVVPVACMTIGKVVNACARSQQTHEQTITRDKRIYDHSTGRYVSLRRKMTGAEQLEYERYRRQGFGVAETLSMMNLLGR